MTIQFCATGKSGLGHLRRITNIARAIKTADSSMPLALMTNAPAEGLTSEELSFYEPIDVFPRSDMAKILAQKSDSVVVVVDTAVLPGLAVVDAPL